MGAFTFAILYVSFKRLKDPSGQFYRYVDIIFCILQTSEDINNIFSSINKLHNNIRLLRTN